MCHSPSKCLFGLQISKRFEDIPVQKIQFTLAIRSISKPKFSMRYSAVFLLFMTFIKHDFQSEILRTVNSKGSFNFVNLDKNYGTSPFEKIIQ